MRSGGSISGVSEEIAVAAAFDQAGQQRLVRTDPTILIMQPLANTTSPLKCNLLLLSTGSVLLVCRPESPDGVTRLCSVASPPVHVSIGGPALLAILTISFMIW